MDSLTNYKIARGALEVDIRGITSLTGMMEVLGLNLQKHCEEAGVSIVRYMSFSTASSIGLVQLIEENMHEYVEDLEKWIEYNSILMDKYVECSWADEEAPDEDLPDELKEMIAETRLIGVELGEMIHTRLMALREKL